MRRYVGVPASVRECGRPHSGTVAVSAGFETRTIVGVSRCRNRFVDPWCSIGYRREQAKRCTDLMVWAVDRGWEAVIAVATVRHQRGESLHSVMADLQAVHSKWSVHRAVRQGGLALMRIPDIVVGGDKGPHPHNNLTMLFPPGSDVSLEGRRRMMQVWVDCSLKVKAKRRAPLQNGFLLRSVGDLLRPGRIEHAAITSNNVRR